MPSVREIKSHYALTTLLKQRVWLGKETHIYYIFSSWIHKCTNSQVAGATSSVSFAAFCLKLTLSSGKCIVILHRDRKPSQTSNILVPFKLSMCLMVSCQCCGDFESHFQEFTQNSNNVSTDVTLHVLEALLIYFLFVTHRSIQPLWLFPYQIQFYFKQTIKTWTNFFLTFFSVKT